MGNGIGMGFGLGTLVVVACAAAVTCSIGCSGADAPDSASEDDVSPANPASTAPGLPPAPPPPASPLPDGLTLDAGVADGAAEAMAPVDPGFRTMWAVDGNGRLARFTSTSPGKVTTLPLSGVAAGERIVGVDFRPADGKLYALGTSSRLYVVDRDKGVATPIGTKPFSPALAGSAFGFDVNPVADKIRVHSDFDQNLRLDPTLGTATTDGMLAFASGDPNQGQSPNLVATAYTNSVSPKPAATVLYAIDSTRNLLTKLATPNDGKVTTVGPLGVDVTDVAGFDIWGGASATGAARPLLAYAVLMIDGQTGLFTIDLDNGAAALVGAIGSTTAIHGLAIEP